MLYQIYRYESKMHRTSIVFFFKIITLCVKSNELPIYNLHHVGHIKPDSLLTSLERKDKHHCFMNNKRVECLGRNNLNVLTTFTAKSFEEKVVPFHDSSPYRQKYNSNMKPVFNEAQPGHGRIYLTNPPGVMNLRPLSNFPARIPAKPIPLYRPGYASVYFNQMPKHDLRPNIIKGLNMPSMPYLHAHASGGLSSAQQPTSVNSWSSIAHNQLTSEPSVAMGASSVLQQMLTHKNMTSIDKFTKSLDHFERQFYTVTFTKLTSISPANRQENGMSFVQSGFFLLLTLMTLSREVDSNTRNEIDRCIGLQVAKMDTISIVKHFITSLPDSSDKLKLRWSSRLMLWPGRDVSPQFLAGGAAALRLHVDKFNGTETTDNIATILNQKVETDSGGAIHDTFDESDVTGGVTAVLVTTLYIRGCWRTAPTVLNGSRPFHDDDNAPKRTMRMIRINDIMKYADLNDWNAQALEISYGTPGLSLLMLIPRGNSLRSLVRAVNKTSIVDIMAKMRTMRVAATVPLYTLRMTLLLPNKLQAMGISSLVKVSNITQARASSLKLSHAVQRIMFWAEAGRNAYKDDGIEWDQAPDLEVVVDRPYIFFVRWRNITLINGNFVL